MAPKKSTRSSGQQTTPLSPTNPSTATRRSGRSSRGDRSHGPDIALPENTGNQGDTIQAQYSSARGGHRSRETSPPVPIHYLLTYV